VAAALVAPGLRRLELPRRLSCAQVAAALWLQLQGLELTAERAADLLEAERLRRA